MKKIKLSNKKKNIIILVLVLVLTPIVTVSAERIIISSNVSYDNGTSGLASSNVQGAVDELYTKCFNNTFAGFLKSLPSSNTVISDDGTAGHNMRYIGANPNNWISFNDELWRIIGVFDTDSHGQKQKLVKIQYGGNIGRMQWDANNANDWSKSALMSYLNTGTYYTN